MSRTRIRQYRAVWEAACRIAEGKEGCWHGYVTVGEVVSAMGVSRPTVLNYMKEGVKDGYFAVWGGSERMAGLYKVLISE